MSGESVLLNSGKAPFVQDERDSAETDIYGGNFLTTDSNGEVSKTSGEASTGEGTIADVDSFDPDVDKGEDLTSGNAGERIRTQEVPVGGQLDARLIAGGDLTTAANANITEGDLLVESDLGALAAFSSAETSGTPEGALYRALESVDNSGAAAGVSNQTYINVERIA